MSLIAVQTLADYLGVEPTESGLQAVLDRAESYTATLIGASDLSARAGVVETVTVNLRNPDNNLSGGVYEPNVFYFSDGPVSNLSLVTLNGSDITTDCTLVDRGWMLTYPILLRSFRFDPAFYDPGLFNDRYLATLEVTYDAGYASEADLPLSLKQYVLMTATKYHSLPVDGVYMVRVGDNYVTIDREMFEAEYRRNEGLLNRYKRGFL